MKNCLDDPRRSPEFTKSVKVQKPATAGERLHRAGGSDPGPSAGGTGPRAHTRKLLVHRELRGARRGTSILAPPCARTPTGSGYDGVEPGHTPRSGDSDRRVRMLLSFQRPSHLSGGGFPPSGRPAYGFPHLGRTDEYSAQSDHLARACRRCRWGSDRAVIVAGRLTKRGPPWSRPTLAAIKPSARRAIGPCEPRAPAPTAVS